MSAAIDHAGRAIELMDAADGTLSADWESQTGELKADQIALAQVHATLALVEQQRLANVIAVAGNNPGPTLSKQVKEALGLS